MAKWSKKILGLAAIGSAAAGLVYYFKKSKKWDEDDFNDDFEDEDFDLDNDLQPVDRGYVNLNASKETTEDADSEDADAQTEEKETDSDESAETSAEDEKETDAESIEEDLD
nr:hypothetical protein [uncultured Dorea sp.]